MWLEWTHAAFAGFDMSLSYWNMILHPTVLLHVIQFLNQSGTWNYQRDEVQGYPLLFLWIGEAGIILAAGVLFPIKGLFTDDPSCRHSNRAPSAPSSSTQPKTAHTATPNLYAPRNPLQNPPEHYIPPPHPPTQTRHLVTVLPGSR